MKKENVTISFESEQLAALEFSLKKKNTSVQAQLEELLKCLYESEVPEPVREYLDSRAAVILNVAHIDRRQVQLCRHAAERQAARHTLLPKEAAKGLFHAFHLLVRSLDWEQCQYSKHLFD